MSIPQKNHNIGVDYFRTFIDVLMTLLIPLSPMKLTFKTKLPIKCGSFFVSIKIKIEVNMMVLKFVIVRDSISFN